MTTPTLRAEQVIRKWEKDADRVLSAPWERAELVTAIASLIAEVREGERERGDVEEQRCKRLWEAVGYVCDPDVIEEIENRVRAALGELSPEDQAAYQRVEAAALGAAIREGEV